MKLFYYDSKHEQVYEELDLGDVDTSLLEKVIDWLEKIKIIDGRYKALTLADKYQIIYHDGEPEVFFCDRDEDVVKVICPTCGGRGFYSGIPDDYSAEDCTTCDSTGEIFKKVKI